MRMRPLVEGELEMEEEEEEEASGEVREREPVILEPPDHPPPGPALLRPHPGRPVSETPAAV